LEFLELKSLYTSSESDIRAAPITVMPTPMYYQIDMASPRNMYDSTVNITTAVLKIVTANPAEPLAILT